MEPFQRGAGPYAVSERETRAILEFFLAHPEIAVVVSLGQGDRPERAGVGADDHVPGADAAIYRQIDEWVESIRGRALATDHESSGRTRVGGAGQLIPEPTANASGPSAPRAVVPGHFAEWAYFQGGAFAIMPAVWLEAPPLPSDAPADSAAMAGDSTDETETAETGDDGEDAKPSPGETDEAPEPRDARAAAWLALLDDVAEREGTTTFVPWHTFDHPTLGSVEIGGVVDAAREYAPRAAIDSLAVEHATILLDVASRLGRVAIRRFEAEPLGAGLHRVTMEVENTGELPTLSMRGADSRRYHQALAEITPGSDATLVDTYSRVPLGRLDPHERRTVEWLVRGTPGATVAARVFTVRAGADRATLTLE